MNFSIKSSGTLCLVLIGAACASGSRAASQSTAPVTTNSGAATQAVDSTPVRGNYTRADVQFMTGMIPHHAQALVMAGWAESHGASPAILTLTARITNAQRDEIASMQKWLRDRNLPVAPADPHGMTMSMGGMQHTMLMPGMLTEDQLKQLDSARGKDFDRLFLTFMIQHHQGAVSMVKDLFETNGAAQDVSVFKVASDIFADQTTEIERMQKMLASMVFGAQTE